MTQTLTKFSATRALREMTRYAAEVAREHTKNCGNSPHTIVVEFIACAPNCRLVQRIFIKPVVFRVNNFGEFEPENIEQAIKEIEIAHKAATAIWN